MVDRTNAELTRDRSILRSEDGQDIIESARQTLNCLESVASTLSVSAARDEADAVAEANASSAVAWDDLMRRTQADKDALEFHIKSLIHERDKQQLQIANTVNELASKSQAAAAAANALLDYGVSDNIVDLTVRYTRPTTVLRTPVPTSREASPALSVTPTIRKSRRTGRAVRSKSGRGGSSHKLSPSAGPTPG